ncbi:MAG: hypothetical protein P5700_24465, partial [Arthrospira platensis PCC 7345]|nr:hypothetical protein [Arthrospira platensis PCC 7345]
MDNFLRSLHHSSLCNTELDGIPKTEASQVFHVSRNTINLWLQRKEHTGDFLPKPNRPPGHSHQITDWHKFKAFAQEHGD